MTAQAGWCARARWLWQRAILASGVGRSHLQHEPFRQGVQRHHKHCAPCRELELQRARVARIVCKATRGGGRGGDRRTTPTHPVPHNSRNADNLQHKHASAAPPAAKLCTCGCRCVGCVQQHMEHGRPQGAVHACCPVPLFLLPVQRSTHSMHVGISCVLLQGVSLVPHPSKENYSRVLRQHPGPLCC